MSMRRWLVVSLLFVTLLCSAQQRRALLVGVANYPEESGWRKIHADNDVSLLESVLSSSFSIKSILDEKATLDNILKELAGLKNATCHGDTVLVSFSCHGQQMIAVGKEESDSLDEALIPYDAKVKYSSDYHGENHLRDDVLSEHIFRLRKAAGSDGLVIVLLDACHSGDSFRDTKEMENFRGGYPVFGPDSTVRAVHKDLKNVVGVAKSNGISDVLFMSACQSYQLNAEYKVSEGKWYGSLTYSFIKAYEKDGLKSLSSLCADIRSNVESFNKRTRQSPEFATTIDALQMLEEKLDTTIVETDDCGNHGADTQIYWIVGLAILLAVIIIVFTYGRRNE